MHRLATLGVQLITQRAINEWLVSIEGSHEELCVCLPNLSATRVEDVHQVGS